MVTVKQALMKARRDRNNFRVIRVTDKKGNDQGLVVMKRDARTKTGFRVKSWTWNVGSKKAKMIVEAKVKKLIKLSQR